MGARLIAPFAAGNKAEEYIQGRKFVQCEVAAENVLTKVREIDHADWTKTSGTIDANATLDPIGTTTADKFEETAVGGVHGVTQAYSVDGSSQYVLSVFLKAEERSEVFLEMNTTGYPANCDMIVDLSDGTVTSAGAGLDQSGIEEYVNGWYRCWMAATSDAAVSTNHRFLGYAGGTGYTGVAGYGFYVWNPQLEVGEFPSSPILTDTVAVTRASDQLYWASADVPPALRGKIRFDLVPFWGSTDAGDKYIFDFKASGASPRIYGVYAAGADRINIVGAGVYSNSQTLTFSRYQLLTLTIDPATAYIHVSGATTGNGAGTATTAWATTEGDVHWGSNNISSAHFNGLISEPYRASS